MKRLKNLREAIIRAHKKGKTQREIIEKALKKTWKEITLETLVEIVDDFPKHLKACVNANGGHFE